MSVIDSGLGWKCDSDYFVNEADAELAIISTDTAYKALQGAAITAQITNGNSTQLFLISTVENNAKLKMNSSLRTVYSVSVGGEMWYISLSYMSSSVTSDYPLITASKGETLNDTTQENLAKIITEITEAADVVFAKKIPTVDYIHQYVEGVEAETVNRVNAVKNMITPVFDTQTVYAVGDYCIYNNGLYKCTTAHTGAWSANDFTSVSVMDEIKNASGGGGLPETTKIVTFDRYIDDFSQSVSKTVTFPVLGNTGYGEINVSGTIFRGSNYSDAGGSSFIGKVPLYYDVRDQKPYKTVYTGASTSGSSATVTSCIGCYATGYSIYVNGSSGVLLGITISTDTLGQITIRLFNPSTDTQRASVTITVIFA